MAKKKPWKPRKFHCKHKGCGFKAKSPSGLGRHYRENPTHASLASAVNPKNERHGKPRKNASTATAKKYSMTPAAVRDRERRAEIKAGSYVPKKRHRSHKRTPEPTVDPRGSACNYCPGCGLFLGPVNTSMRVMASIGKGPHHA